MKSVPAPIITNLPTNEFLMCYITSDSPSVSPGHHSSLPAVENSPGPNMNGPNMNMDMKEKKRLLEIDTVNLISDDFNFNLGPEPPKKEPRMNLNLNLNLNLKKEKEAMVVNSITPTNMAGMKKDAKLRCLSRNQGRGHNQAYFLLQAPPKHGQFLICSDQSCEEEGIKFAWCAVCNRGVAKRNFKKSHSHPETGIVTCEEENFFGFGGLVVPKAIVKKRRKQDTAETDKFLDEAKRRMKEKMQSVYTSSKFSDYTGRGRVVSEPIPVSLDNTPTQLPSQQEEQQVLQPVIKHVVQQPVPAPKVNDSAPLHVYQEFSNPSVGYNFENTYNPYTSGAPFDDVDYVHNIGGEGDEESLDFWLMNWEESEKEGGMQH